MLKTKYANPLEGFVCHGVITDSFTYVLLVDMTGQALIRRITSDQTQMLYSIMPNPNTDNKAQIAEAIQVFWANYSAGPFQYLFQL